MPDGTRGGAELPTKTNAMRLLDARKIEYQVTEYDRSGQFHSATEAAELIGAPASVVYKTIVVLRDPPQSGKPLLVMIASDKEVNLKTLAESVQAKKLRVATQREAEELTGLQVGGISALMLIKRGFEIVIDRDAAVALECIHVSAGQRGIDLMLKVNDLIDVTGARVVNAAG